MTDLDPGTPVLVGVGRADQHFDSADQGRSALDLMVDAVKDALADSGSTSIAEAVDLVMTPAGSWSYRNPGRAIAHAVGIGDARTTLIQAGTPQQTLFNDAYAAVQSGAARVALIVGGEAARRASLARRAGVVLDDPDPDLGEPDENRRPVGEIVSRAEIEARVVSPVETYALIENALRFAEGISIDAQRDEIAALWSGFSKAAAAFEHADFRTALTPAQIRDAGPDNRAMAFPYNKRHCSQMNVDQAAAILVCRLDIAQQLGVDDDRLVFPLVALESSFAASAPSRAQLHRWQAMKVLGDAAAAHLGHPLSDITYAELYSCFPAAVRVQQRELRLPLDGIPTMTGGEPFAGGPWNNFVLQATVEMVHRIRADRGSRGLVTTVSGFLTKPGLAVYSTTPGTQAPLIADLREAAQAATPIVDVLVDFHGPATVVTYTVVPGRTDGWRTIVIADTPSGDRCVAVSLDEATAVGSTTVDLIGRKVTVIGAAFDLA